MLHLKKIAIIQPSDPSNSNEDTIVILDNISEGVDGSNVFGITTDKQELGVNAGEVYFNKTTATADIRVLKPTGNTYSGQSNVGQLKEWADNNEDVYAVGVTVGNQIIYLGDKDSSTPFKISVNEQLSDSDVFAVKITGSGGVGFDSISGLYEGGFWVGKNLLGAYEWADNDGDGIANGFISSNFSSESFTSGVQSLDSGLTEGNFERSFYYPFAGDEITFAVTVDTYPVGENIALLEVESTTKDGTTDSQTQDFDLAGDYSVSLTTPTDVSYITVRISQRAAATTVTGEYSNPMVSLDGSTTYTKF
jgi:hypothetical protein